MSTVYTYRIAWHEIAGPGSGVSYLVFDLGHAMALCEALNAACAGYHHAVIGAQN